MKRLIVFLGLAVHLCVYAKNADLVIFSYNRPIQLYALLESTKKYIRGLDNIFVIYRASDKQFEHAYQGVIKKFDDVQYLVQGQTPKKDFKELTLKAFNGPSSEYVVFAVDDIIVKDFIDIDTDIALLQKTDAYGMYYRLGKHLTDCYPTRRKQPLPNLKQVEGNVFTWRFNRRIFDDWNYPHTVDMTLFKKTDIKDFFERFEYNAPNPLEGRWSCQKPAKSTGLCHSLSKIVNLPMNLVQEKTNRNSNSYSAEKLLDLFNQGLKIDINTLHQIKNPSAHMDYDPTFIER